MPFYHSRKPAPPRPDEATLHKPVTAQSAKAPTAASDSRNPAALDLTDLEPLPLDEAAAQLEIQPEELLKAFRAGAYRGFVDEGTLFVYVPASESEDGDADDGVEVAPPKGGAPDWPSLGSEWSGAERSSGGNEEDDITPLHSSAALQESTQQQEIQRLRKANRDLQDEKDRLFRLLEREQVLRQGIQRTLDRAWINLLPPMDGTEKTSERIQTIDRYAKEPQEPARRASTEEAPLDIGSFLGRQD